MILDSRIAYLQKDYKSVVENGNSLLAGGDTVYSNIRLFAISLYHTGEYEEALHWLNFLIPDYGSEQVYFYISMAHYRKGDYELAEDFMRKALDEVIPQNLHTYYTQLGILLEQQGKYKEAIEAYKEAYALNQNPDLNYRLARVSDMYYKDNSIAEGYYNRFLEESDTMATVQKDYAEQRLREIQRVRFFKKDSI